MQRQFTIELRVDYADNEKNGVMKTAIAQCARHAYATACLLSDGQEPTVAVFSEDFFVGKEDIALMLDAVGEAMKDVKQSEAGVSQELLEAFNESKANGKHE